MNIAVQGCCHGELDEIYHQIQKYQKIGKLKIDVLLICGDFQALRNNNDLDHMHCPQKYKNLGNFFQYYCGNKQPYVPTIIIGGNHEAVNHSRQLYFGGYVAPKIYYLGQTGSIWLRKGDFKIRVSGISGIFSFKSFWDNNLEVFPFESHSNKITAYHYKQTEILKLDLFARNVGDQIDVFLSHDWPSNITEFGDKKDLLIKKPFFKEDIDKGELGCPCLKYLSPLIQSSYWFSAHLHVKFPAVQKHEDNRQTHFLALDKCLKNRNYLQFIELENPSGEPSSNSQIVFEYDVEWLTVLKLTEGVLLEGKRHYEIKNKELVLKNVELIEELSQQFLKTKESIQEKLKDNRVISFEDFKETVLSGPGNYKIPDLVKLNPQTERILDLISSDKQKYDRVLFYNNQKEKKPKPVYKQKKQYQEEKEGWGENNEVEVKEKPEVQGQEIELDL